MVKGQKKWLIKPKCCYYGSWGSLVNWWRLGGVDGTSQEKNRLSSIHHKGGFGNKGRMRGTGSDSAFWFYNTHTHTHTYTHTHTHTQCLAMHGDAHHVIFYFPELQMCQGCEKKIKNNCTFSFLGRKNVKTACVCICYGFPTNKLQSISIYSFLRIDFLNTVKLSGSPHGELSDHTKSKLPK